MGPSLRVLPVLLVATAQVIDSLEVAPGSPCATHCLDSPGGNEWNTTASTINTNDVTCKDSGYFSTSKGKKFKKCLNCLQHSTRAHEGESDLEWFIYNIRFTLSTCIFSKPKAAIDSNADSPCNTDKACGRFQGPLSSDGPSPNVNTTWDYCGIGDGTFMGDHLEPCISCLRSTDDHTYLANFVTALEAGCKQSPGDVSSLGLSGTLFTSDAVNLTDPVASTDKHHSHPLPLSAIIGIVVGVVLLFVLAIGLFLVHCSRERAYSHYDNAYYYGDEPETPKTLVDPWGYVITKPRRIPGFHDRRRHEKDQSDDKNNEYHDRLEEASRTGRLQYTHDPRCANQGPDNMMPAHQAYKPHVVPKRDSKQTASPVSKHRPSTPDSFVAGAYISAVQDASQHSKLQPSSTQPPAELQPVAITSPTQSSWGSKIPSMILPSLPKIRIPKRYTPPKLALQPATPADDPGERQLRISPPLLNPDPRFDDRPLGAGIVVLDRNRPPTPKNSNKYEAYTEVPLRSGKSALYGM